MPDDVIAVDGPAASGKSTVAQMIADRIGAYYVNTGNMYRAVALCAIKSGLTNPFDADKIVSMLSGLDISYVKKTAAALELMVNGKSVDKAIRLPETAKYASAVAAIPQVREWLIERQRQTASLGMIVMEGRDIGTVIFPHARFKFYLTASPEVRARRRLEQAGESPDGSTIASVAKEIALRDEMDMNRSVAPLRKADDAVLIDSSKMTIDEVVQSVVNTVRGRAQ